jgi:hypothetical protein
MVRDHFFTHGLVPVLLARYHLGAQTGCCRQLRLSS